MKCKYWQSLKTHRLIKVSEKLQYQILPKKSNCIHSGKHKICCRTYVPTLGLQTWEKWQQISILFNIKPFSCWFYRVMTIKGLDQSGKTPFVFRSFQENRGDLMTLANQRLRGFSLKNEIASSTKLASDKPFVLQFWPVCVLFAIGNFKRLIILLSVSFCKLYKVRFFWKSVLFVQTLFGLSSRSEGYL